MWVIEWPVFCAYDPSNNHLFSGSYDNTIKVWDTLSQQCIHSFKGHSNYVTCLAYDPSKQLLLSGSADNTIRVWDTQNQLGIHTFFAYGADDWFSVEQDKLRIKGSSLAWRYANFSNGKETFALDAFDFEVV